MATLNAVNVVPPSARLAAGVVNIPILGDLFNDMLDRVQTTIDGIISRAEGALLEAEMEAGRQVALAIENAKNAYAEMLQMTVDKVEKAVTDNLYQLEGMIESFQEGNQQFLEDAASRVQMLINSLPFSNLQPQLMKYKPRNIVVGAQENVIMTFSGNFPFSADPKFPPALSFNDQKYAVSGKTTFEFDFKVPVRQLFPDKADTPTHSFSYISGDLSIPWDNTSNLPFYRRWLGYTDYRTYIYKVLMAALPLSPGRITAIYSKDVSGPTVRQRFVSQTEHEDASHAYRRPCKDWDVHRHSYSPNSSFRFIPGTAAIVRHKLPNEPHGNNIETITGSSDSRIDVEVKLDACSGKHMGIVTFHVECDEFKSTTQNQIKSIPVEMKWNETRILNMKTDDGVLTSIIFQGFDGNRYEFGTVTDLTNRYLKVYNQADKVQIKAIPPSDVVTLRLASQISTQ